MRMSTKKRQEVYDAIHEPIMDLRVKAEMGNGTLTEADLFGLDTDIWADIRRVLSIEEE